MSATAWFIIAIVGFSLSGVALVTAVFMFIKMNIPAIIGDLTGKTVAREIKAMRESNASSGDKRFRPSAVNMERGTLTEKVKQAPLDATALKKAHASKRLDQTEGLAVSKKLKKPVHEEKETNSFNATEALSDNVTEFLSSGATDVLDSGATDVLDSGATELLDSGATELLDSGATELLSDNEDEFVPEGTTVLSSTEELQENEDKPVKFKVVYSQILVHSDEVI